MNFKAFFLFTWFNLSIIISSILFYNYSFDKSSLCECEKEENIAFEPRIVNGSSINKGDLSSLAVLFYVSHGKHPYTNQSHHQLCSGTILNSRFGLSAAHCFFRNESIPLDIDRLRFGSGSGHNLDRIVAEQNFKKLSRYYIHPDVLSDLAIVEFKHPFDLSNDIRPACLYDLRIVKDRNLSLITAGYGQLKSFSIKTNKSDPTDKNGESFEHLYDPSARYTFLEQFIFSDDNSDLLIFHHQSRSISQEDLGGPTYMYSQNKVYQIGVSVNFGYSLENNESLYLGVVQQIYPKLDWIKRVTNSFLCLPNLIKSEKKRSIIEIVLIDLICFLASLLMTFEYHALISRVK